MQDYETFLESKLFTPPTAGIEPKGELNPKLYDFQSDLVRWASAQAAQKR